MRPMSKFEKKFGKYAIKNISLMLILCYACGYLITMINPVFLNYLSLNPYLILRGQVWRLFTWIIIPPTTSPDFWTLIMLFFYYSIGTNLEHAWGTYRLNVYLFSGMIFTVIGSFLLMGYIYLFAPGAIAYYDGAENYFVAVAVLFSTYYVNMSIFLAYAATFAEARILLFFIIPIKVKYLGIIYGVMLVYEFVMGNIYSKFVILASLLNFILFFVTSRSHVHLAPRQIKRRYEFKQDVKKGGDISRHKCAVCGRTEANDPDLEFRFCSKCEGNYEYCQDHLYTHPHIKG